MPRIPVNDTIYLLLHQRAKRENKRIEVLANELLNKALWNEPGCLFKGKTYKVEPDLFIW